MTTQRSGSRVSAPRRAVTAVAIGAALVGTLGLAACGDRSPFGDKSSGTSPAVASAAGATPAPADATPTGSASDLPPQPPLASTPGAAPGPDGTVASGGTKDAPKPKTLAGRIAADKTAMLNIRTMVSVIEGCHSGSTSYRDCNTHKELGSPELLGVEIGRAPGQVQIAATKNGFRMTARSMSGAKFTVARGPKGDRFSCIPRKHPGACPADRKWTW